MKTSNAIEALLFWKGEPVSKNELAKLLHLTLPEVEEGLTEVKNGLSGRGLSLVENADKVMLATGAEAGELIERLTKEELSKDLGRAGLETLTAILYAAPLTRTEIDWVRGVNSSFIIRHLLIRGLVERLPKPGDARTYIYQPSFNLLNYLGVTAVNNLPEYQSGREAVLTALRNKQNDSDGE